MTHSQIMDQPLSLFPANDPAEQPDFVTALARGLAVIRAFGTQSKRMSLAEIARQVNLPRATVRRSLITLETLGYVESELISREMNAFDAALALMALAHLNADVASFTPALHVIVASSGEGGRHGPYKAYEWNKMKTPTRILVGGPEVTSAFVLMGLALARRAMRPGQRPS